MTWTDDGQRWRDRVEGGYAALAEKADGWSQYVGLWLVADGLHLMADHAHRVASDPDELATLRHDRRLAWVLAACAGNRVGEDVSFLADPDLAPVTTWPALEHTASTSLRVLRDPASDATALHTAYAAVEQAARELGGSPTVAKRLAAIWQQHASRPCSDASGKDQ